MSAGTAETLSTPPPVREFTGSPVQVASAQLVQSTRTGKPTLKVSGTYVTDVSSSSSVFYIDDLAAASGFALSIVDALDLWPEERVADPE